MDDKSCLAQQVYEILTDIPMSATLKVLPLTTSKKPAPVLLIIAYNVCHGSRKTVADKLRTTGEPSGTSFVALRPFPSVVCPLTESKSSTVLKMRNQMYNYQKKQKFCSFFIRIFIIIAFTSEILLLLLLSSMI